jgi:serine/threonine protein kinase
VIDLAAYVLEPLWQEGACLLYRGQPRDRSAGIVPAVLVVAPVGNHPAPASLRRLEHEYALRAELDPAWAVRPLALAQHQGRPALVLEDPGGEPLARLLGRPLAVPQGVRLAIGLAAALGQLHERGLIHKDLKPAHMFVNGATGQVWLTGFGIASRRPRQRPSPAPPEFIAGTLAYMAPEQTGRMNRSVDARSDLYTLGVTLYEMLTGSLPFTASEPLEWVHCHLARQPVPPAARVPEVPGAVSAIILKLLAKTAEDRYQTAAGVEHDLRRCLAAWETQGRIDDFPLGTHDTPDRLVMSEKLYGRARDRDSARRLRPRRDERDAGAGTGLRVRRHRQVLCRQ